MEENLTKENQSVYEESLPNSLLTLILGIGSILTCCCAPISIPAGIVAWVLGNKGRAKYKESAGEYTASSYSNLNAGRVCGIVGVVLTTLVLANFAFNVYKLGGWDAYMDTVRDAMEQYEETHG